MVATLLLPLITKRVIRSNVKVNASSAYQRQAQRMKRPSLFTTDGTKRDPRYIRATGRYHEL